MQISNCFREQTRLGGRGRLTFDSLAIPSSRDPVDRVRHLPVLISNLHKAHRDLSGGPGCLQDVSAPARDGRLGRRAHDNSLSGDGGETIYMRSQMNLDDVVFCEF